MRAQKKPPGAVFLCGLPGKARSAEARRLLGREGGGGFDGVFEEVAHFFGVEFGDVGFAHAQGDEAGAVLALALGFGGSAFGGAGDNGFGEFASDTHDGVSLVCVKKGDCGCSGEKGRVLCPFGMGLARRKWENLQGSGEEEFVDGEVVGFGGEGGEALEGEGDAEGVGGGGGEEAVVDAAAAAEAVAFGGEGAAGDEDEVEVGGGDGVSEVRKGDAVVFRTSEVEVGDVAELPEAVFFGGDGEGLGEGAVEGGEVGFVGEGDEDADAAGGADAGVAGELAAEGVGLGAAVFGGEGGEAGAEDAAEGLLVGHEAGGGGRLGCLRRESQKERRLSRVAS